MNHSQQFVVNVVSRRWLSVRTKIKESQGFQIEEVDMKVPIDHWTKAGRRNDQKQGKRKSVSIRLMVRHLKLNHAQSTIAWVKLKGKGRLTLLQERFGLRSTTLLTWTIICHHLTIIQLTEPQKEEDLRLKPLKTSLINPSQITIKTFYLKWKLSKTSVQARQWIHQVPNCVREEQSHKASTSVLKTFPSQRGKLTSTIMCMAQM